MNTESLVGQGVYERVGGAVRSEMALKWCARVAMDRGRRDSESKTSGFCTRVEGHSLEAGSAGTHMQGGACCATASTPLNGPYFVRGKESGRNFDKISGPIWRG